MAGPTRRQGVTNPSQSSPLCPSFQLPALPRECEQGPRRNCFLLSPLLLHSLPLPKEVGRALGILAGGSGIRFLGGCCCGNCPSNPSPCPAFQDSPGKACHLCPLTFPWGLQTGGKRGPEIWEPLSGWVSPWACWSTLLIPSTRPAFQLPPLPPLSLALRTTSGSLQNSSC